MRPSSTVGADLEGTPILDRDTFRPSTALPHIVAVDDYRTLRAVGRMRHACRGHAPVLRDAQPDAEGEYLLDLEDFTGAVNLVATEDGEPTAALRVTLLGDPHQPRRTALATLAARFALDEGTTLVCTRLVRAHDHDGGHLDDLVRFVALRAGEAGFRCCLVLAPGRLVPLLSRLGLRRSGHTVSAPDGRHLMMMLDTSGAIRMVRA